MITLFLIALALSHLPSAGLGFSLSGPEVASRLFVIVLLIAINAFFVMAEFSVVAVRRSRINQLAQEGDVPAQTVQGLQRDLDRLLSTTQLGITLSSLALGWISENTMAAVLMTWARPGLFTGQQVQVMAHSLAMPLAFLAIAYLQIVLGELCPKAMALLYAENLARLLAPISLTIARLFSPFIWVLNQSTRCLLRLGGIKLSPQSWSAQVTPEELQLIIATSTESSGLEAEERELLTNVFEFGTVRVEEVMVPRTSIHAIHNTATFQALLEEMTRSSHDYYPVMGESLDDIRGILRFQDLAVALANGQLQPQTCIQPWVQAAWFVSEGTPIIEVLQLMQKYRLDMVMVREDELNGTAGLVTLTDLVNEIIGSDDHPPHTHTPPIQEQDNHTFIIQAQTDLETVNERLAIQLPLVENYQTLGGFLLYQAQKMPQQGETYTYQNLALTVLSAEGPRLDQIQLQILAPGTSTQDQSFPSDGTHQGKTALAADEQSAQTPDHSTIQGEHDGAASDVSVDLHPEQGKPR